MQNNYNKEEKVEKEENSKFPYLKVIGVIALIYLIGFTIYLFISSIMLFFLTKPSKEIKVPDLVGKRFVNVYNSLVRNGIKPEIKFKDIYDIDDGIILNQHPESGSIVAKDSTLKVTVSRSNLYIEIPNLVGKELPIAVNKIKNLHFNDRLISLSLGTVSYIPSSRSADNIVIDQSPRAGERITLDRKVNLLVSIGKMDVDRAMPNVLGQSIDLCFDLLLAKGFTVNEEIVETKDIQQSGLIVSQTPDKGVLLKKGDMVTIKVNWYSWKEHPYFGYELVDYQIPEDQKEGLYEAYIEDNKSKRIRFSRRMKPGQRIKFIFERVGDAKVTITSNKNNIRVMGIDVD